MSQTLHNLGGPWMPVTDRPIIIQALSGYNRSANDIWLQLFDINTNLKPANGAVPKRSIRVFADLAFNLPFFGAPLGFYNGLVIVPSTTEATLTYTAAGFDYFVEIEPQLLPFNQRNGVTGVGSISTAESELEVWADAVGPKQLVSVFVRNGTAGAIRAWIVPFSGQWGQGEWYDGTGTAALHKCPTFDIPAGKIRYKQFGMEGVDLRKITFPLGTEFTVNKGCSVILTSTDDPPVTVLDDQVDDVSILAYYKS